MCEESYGIEDIQKEEGRKSQPTKEEEARHHGRMRMSNRPYAHRSVWDRIRSLGSWVLLSVEETGICAEMALWGSTINQGIKGCVAIGGFCTGPCYGTDRWCFLPEIS